MSAVPTPEDSNGRPSAEAVEQGVLSNLPRTRPQRATERRIAARNATKQRSGKGEPRKRASSRKGRTGAAGATGTASKADPASATEKAGAATAEAKRAARPKPAPARKPRARSEPARTRVRTQEPAPRQGFEAEGERASGPVQPPGGAELVASAAEIVSEIAKAGLSAGERAVRDLFSRLPL
jgi:hypothetical protein